MSVLTIRAYKRYATRLPVQLKGGEGTDASGLLIELSQQGARISGLSHSDFEVGEEVAIVTSSGLEFPGNIRWAHDGLAGIRLQRSLHLPEMRELLDLNRAEQPQLDVRYGT